jgi:hypothetical protein
MTPGSLLISLSTKAPSVRTNIPGEATYTFNGNWKLPFENGLDFYHRNSTHSSYVDILAERGKRSTLGILTSEDELEAQGREFDKANHYVNSTMPSGQRFQSVRPPGTKARRILRAIRRPLPSRAGSRTRISRRCSRTPTEARRGGSGAGPISKCSIRPEIGGNSFWRCGWLACPSPSAVPRDLASGLPHAPGLAAGRAHGHDRGGRRIRVPKALPCHRQGRIFFGTGDVGVAVGVARAAANADCVGQYPPQATSWTPSVRARHGNGCKTT